VYKSLYGRATTPFPSKFYSYDVDTVTWNSESEESALFQGFPKHVIEFFCGYSFIAKHDTNPSSPVFDFRVQNWVAPGMAEVLSWMLKTCRNPRKAVGLMGRQDNILLSASMELALCKLGLLKDAHCVWGGIKNAWLCKPLDPDLAQQIYHNFPLKSKIVGSMLQNLIRTLDGKDAECVRWTGYSGPTTAESQHQLLTFLKRNEDPEFTAVVRAFHAGAIIACGEPEEVEDQFGNTDRMQLDGEEANKTSNNGSSNGLEKSSQKRPAEPDIDIREPPSKQARKGEDIIEGSPKPAGNGGNVEEIEVDPALNINLPLRPRKFGAFSFNLSCSFNNLNIE